MGLYQTHLILRGARASSLDKLIRNITAVAAMAVPMYGCEGDSTTNNTYEGSGGSSESYNSCESGCKMVNNLCLTNDYNSCMDECEGDVNDGQGVPSKFFDCVYNACKDQPSEPQTEAVEKCWEFYKHQG